MSKWTSCSERLPEIPDNAPGYAAYKVVLVVAGGVVKPMTYARNPYAKTEKGRAPRWQEYNGGLAFSEPTHWCELPEAPDAD